MIQWPPLQNLVLTLGFERLPNLSASDWGTHYQLNQNFLKTNYKINGVYVSTLEISRQIHDHCKCQFLSLNMKKMLSKIKKIKQKIFQHSKCLLETKLILYQHSFLKTFLSYALKIIHLSVCYKCSIPKANFV